VNCIKDHFKNNTDAFVAKYSTMVTWPIENFITVRVVGNSDVKKKKKKEKKVNLFYIIIII
jgi:hypothetical protein